MSMKPSIWTLEGRFDRIGKKITPERLEKLKKKRNRQLTNMIERYEKICPKKVRRWEARISN